jgi:hypothetical protein
MVTTNADMTMTTAKTTITIIMMTTTTMTTAARPSLRHPRSSGLIRGWKLPSQIENRKSLSVEG